MPQYCAVFKNHIPSVSEEEIDIKSDDNDIDLLRISKTMFAKRLFINKICSVLSDRPVTWFPDFSANDLSSVPLSLVAASMHVHRL